MAKAYNVWIEVEMIDEAKNEDGTDILTEKVAKFRKEKDAIKFAMRLAKENDTSRDKDHFTI